MINAKEAKEQSVVNYTKNLRRTIDNIVAIITKAISEGKYEAYVYDINQELREEVVEILVGFGYEVRWTPRFLNNQEKLTICWG